jgi:hypothetical protein
MVPFPLAREALASKSIPRFQIFGFILRLERFVAFTPLMSKITSQSFGLTSICFSTERGSTSVFHLLLRLPDTTSRNTVKVPSWEKV